MGACMSQVPNCTAEQKAAEKYHYIAPQNPMLLRPQVACKESGGKPALQTDPQAVVVAPGHGTLYRQHQELLQSAGATYNELDGAGFRKGDCLLIVDMQNDFLPEADAPDGGRLGVSEGADAAAVIVKLTKAAAAAGATIVATRDYHPKKHCSFIEQQGPFPAHCVQGSKGSFFFAPVEQALRDAKSKGGDVRVVFKGFAQEVDSFGAVRYPKEYFNEKGLGHKLCTSYSAKIHGCCALDWTGAFALECSNIDEDINAPPDVMAVFSRKSLAQELQEVGTGRLFVCGLALDICVLDSALNAAAARVAPDGIYVLADAARAVHIPGVGAFGSGFLNEPAMLVKKCREAGVNLAHASTLDFAPGSSSM